ncbi:unnamed protein product [Brachionus calyciflorus]|uniref:Rab3 GTPase-activating protein catalytic subunit n=1 Tax=Brachionus calyciflorus TaxID=104777 RepID=A0A813YG94_9BILA|nr:unnamed protein product [Brachionus calyciflorus]
MSVNKPLETEDAEDHEIFDINDFTTASDWERFVVQIEELINEWKLNSNISDNLIDGDRDINFENGEWQHKTETLQFAEEISFTLTYYYLTKKNENDKNNLNNSKKDQVKNISIDFDSSTNQSNNSQLEADENSVNLVNLPPKSMADLLNKTNDFQNVTSSQTITPSIAYWYGLCRFLVISPTRNNSFIDTESRANVILSSISIAINNTGCLIPIFVQVNSINRDMYLGLCEGSALKTHFQIVHFNYTPPQYSFLPGLLEIFKSKLGNHLTNSSFLISVSVRFTYLIQEGTFLDSQQMNMKASLDKSFQDLDLVDDRIDEIYPDIKNLSFGSIQDCVDSIYLSCIWSNLSEDIIVDSESYSDLNPQHSNDWCITLNNLLDKCEYQLTSSLYKYLDELKRTISVSQLIGPTGLSINSNMDPQVEELKNKSLQKLTSSSSAARRLDKMYFVGSNIVEKATSRMKALNTSENQLPIDKGFLDFIMDYLFPDAKLRQSKETSKQNKNQIKDDLNSEKFLKKISLLKSSSFSNDGLLNKFVICLNLLNRIGQTAAIAQLWQEFILELRYRYESAIIIPGLDNDPKKQNQDSSLIPPDLSRCLLHQKIQMLNCCIKKKQERELIEKESAKKLDNEKQKNNSDEDEFFDCEDEQPILPFEGRLKKFGDLTLLNKPSEYIYVPITQESTPMTEDMLEQHASVLVNLGSSDDASLLRAKIQSASLLSDMQAFKAANPECVLEDFVRWYSPRDWVAVEEKQIDPETNEEKIIKKYELSHRMKIPGNMWVDVWNNAKPVPVRRQKRLFDDTKEAEKIFEWLNSLSIGQIVEQTLPILFYSAIYTCYEEVFKLDLNFLADPIIDLLIEKTIKITRNNETKKYHDLVNYVKSIEQIVSLMKSINAKFMNKKARISSDEEPEVKQFVKKLLKHSLDQESCELKIENGAHGTIGKLLSRLCVRNKITHKSKYNRMQSNEYKSIKNSIDSIDDQDDNDEIEEMENYTNLLLPYDKPFKREYILRSSVSRPAPYSRQSPQRMYCLINNLEFRLAGAFTEDTMFF